ncbi:MAG: hypothetical protein AUG48_07725 [Actinobacteria bacterium 13_1_20CM_3_68_9]|nr:MAG: hypothetical protein AUG48_07725 [Actinobacteria bacterium 13_1_20CM_3_68_9]
MALIALPSAASAGGPQPLLPDLIQVPPPLTSIHVKQDTTTGHYLVEFESIVGNVGAGPFEMHGSLGADNPDMTAYQMIYQDQGPPVQSSNPIGKVHYETDPTHNHWHFQPFDDYELRSLDGSKVWSDEKEGFCLINSLPVPFGTPLAGPAGNESDYSIGDTSDPRYFCYQNHPEASQITEGISVGWADEYAGFRGGTDVDLTGVPAGRYYLVQKVNSNQSVQELDYSNNAWSGPPPPAPPADTIAPKLLLGGATRQRFLRGRAIYVYAKCDEVCTITASGRIAALQVAKALRTASTKLTLKPGARTKIKLPITAHTRAVINRQLRRGARVTVRVSLIAVDASGNRTSSKRTLTLLRR